MDPQPDRRERKKERTRQALRDVAIRLIAERGIYGTRVEDITERTDLGKGAFYNYFESKDRLVAELVTQGIDLLHSNYLSEPDESASQAQRIAAVIASHEAFFEEHPAYLVLFHEVRSLAKTRTPARGALEAVFVEYLRRTGAVIATPADRDRISAADLSDLAAVILGAVAGYRSFRLAAGLPVGSRVVADVLASGLPAALAARLRVQA